MQYNSGGGGSTPETGATIKGKLEGLPAGSRLNADYLDDGATIVLTQIETNRTTLVSTNAMLAGNINLTNTNRNKLATIETGATGDQTGGLV